MTNTANNQESIMLDKHSPTKEIQTKDIETAAFQQEYKAVFDEYVRLRVKGHSTGRAFTIAFENQFRFLNAGDMADAVSRVDRVTFYRIERAIKSTPLADLWSVSDTAALLLEIANSTSASANTKLEALRVLNDVRKEYAKAQGRPH